MALMGVGLLLAVRMGGSTAPSTSTKYYALDVRGGSRLLAADQPIRKGKVVLFHRYPDGAYVSLPADEILAVKSMDTPPAKKASDDLAPGGTLYVGGALEGPRHEMPPGPDMTVSPADNRYGYDYGYSDYGYYGGGGYVRPRPPGPVPPSRIGPNGYPIIAPPGTPGSVPNPIGPNGFPILAPSPAAPVVPLPVPRPRQ
ncbi:MAG TPA: hypothetical protein VH854_17230 [Thermoanaerobaculia bacterium]|nr:hypothetical protein [Thermoanaerobaculia bacterium]